MQNVQNKIALIAALTLATLACSAGVKVAHRQPEQLEGTLVVVHPNKNQATIISLSKRQIVKQIPTGAGPHEAVASPNGKLVAISNYGVQGAPGSSLTIVELPSGEVKKTIDLGKYLSPHGIAWLDNDRVIHTSELTKSLVITNVTTGSVERAMSTDNAGSHMLAISADGKKAFSANIVSGNISVFDVPSGKKIGDVPAGDKTEGIAVTPDGRYAWGGNLAGSVAVIDTQTMSKVKEFSTPGYPIRLSATPDGKSILVSQPMTGEIIVYDAKKMEETKRFKVAPADPVTITIHPNAKFAFASMYKKGAVSIIDLASGKVLDSINVSPIADGLAYSPIEPAS